MTNAFIEEKLAEAFEVINENDPVGIRDWLRTALSAAIEHGQDTAIVQQDEAAVSHWYEKGKEAGHKEKSNKFADRILLNVEAIREEGRREMREEIVWRWLQRH